MTDATLPPPLPAPAGGPLVAETDTVVVGAGPAGLATAACLSRAAVPFVLLERGERLGPAWHTHYDRLHLHTVKQHSALPYLPFPVDYPAYPSRRQVIDYLEGYAAHFRLAPRLGEEVTLARRSDGSWETYTQAGMYRSAHLVVATGFNRVPHLARWPRQETFTGTLLHSAQYRNGESFRGQRVLVVGIGNTGGEIAIDLCEHGAAEVGLSVRTPTNVMPRDFLGRPVQVTSILLARLPDAVRDAIGRTVSRLAFGDLARFGLHPPPYGAATQIARYGRVPLIDVGTIALVKQGAIAVWPDVAGFQGRTVRFADGRERAFDAVILATGYRAQLERFLEGSAQVVDGRGTPRRRGVEAELPGLYFVGFGNTPTGLLREISLEAPRVARAIQARARVSR